MFIQSISIKLAKTDSNNVLADIFNGFKSPGNLIRWLGYNYKYSGDNHCLKSERTWSSSGPYSVQMRFFSSKTAHKF